ncbi:MAG: heme lyase CcmF/NrfE family subunit [Deinococcus-Thermus bacterium]|jgi:cytochrome c-type biogenesis protein CcmF|nr:heme lyase CcmF/NrfE family subunit [Deinococcota bacterium]
MTDLGLGPLGSASLLLALAFALWGMVGGAIGAIRRDARLLTSARMAAFATFLAMTAAIAIMEIALLTDDFSVSYVADTSRSTSPLWVKVVTLWAALEGSLLLWGWLLSGYWALLAWMAPNTPLRPWALTVMATVQSFFVAVPAVVAPPFQTVSPVPMDGPGPNPLLQNHWMMAVHPVLMYLGFVGLTVPFAYAMAALITKRPGSEWMQHTRRWTLVGWGFLTAAIIAGGWWSYEVLGWGGYWAWDPVENVSFLPWLTATAFIHSVQVQERRRMLKAWNLLLITLTFSLTLFGTFLTRSGVVSSVHAFGDGPVGPVFLAFFLAVMAGSLGLVAWRWDQVRDRADLDHPVSREGTFLAGNVLFLAVTFAVLLGTIFPLFVEAVSGDKVTVGAPFFDQATLPLWMGVLALMGIGPLLPWRRAPDQSLRRNLTWMLAVAAVAAGVSAALGMRGVYPLLTVALIGWNLASVTLLLLGAVVPRVRVGTRSVAQVLVSYAHENRRRFGSMVVHFGVVVIAVGILGSSAYRVDEQIRVDIGGSTMFQGHELTVVDRFMERTDQRISAGAIVEVRRGDRLVDTLRPRINSFAGQQMTVPTPSVMYTPWYDIYLNVAGSVGPGQDFVVLRAVRSPLITWIWIGGVILALGTLYALTPSRRSAAATRRAGPQEPAAT